MKIPSVVLLSGGLDSAANLALCALHDHPVLALTVDYGQRAALREFAAAQKLADHFGVPHRTLDLRWLGGLGGSSLTDCRQEVPELDRSELDSLPVIQKTAKSVWVPNRNGVLIQAAAAYAEVMKAGRVIVGFNREEGATFPDNTQAFLDASSQALRFSTRGGAVSVHCYTTDLDKRQIVAKLRSLERPFPFDYLWSCYHGGPTPCGRCESCQRLKRALEGSE